MCDCKAIACIIDVRGIKMKAKRKKKNILKKEELSFESLKQKIRFQIFGNYEDSQFNRHQNIMQIVEVLKLGYSEDNIKRITECYFSSETTAEYLRIAHNYLGDKPEKVTQQKLFNTSRLEFKHGK